MDINEMPMNSTEYGGFAFPQGLGAVLGVTEDMAGEDKELTETEKEHLIMRCKDAQSEEEVQNILNDTMPGGTMQSVLERGQYH